MNPTSFALVLLALPMGFGAAWSTGEWIDSGERSQAQITELKQALIANAGLFELHNKVAAQVGPEAWENRVKPQFMSAVTYATIRETGNLLPDGRDVVDWVRSHPEEARRLIKEASGIEGEITGRPK